MGATVRVEGHVTQTGVGEHFLEDGTHPYVVLRNSTYTLN